MAPPILILSNPRTGSTLLRLLLDTHPDICCPGELRLGMLCELLLTTIELTVGQDETRRSHVKREKYFRQVRHIVNELLDDYCHAMNKQRWCEKTPQNLQYLDFINAIFPDAQCICLHRNVLDMVKSHVEVGVRVGHTRTMTERHDDEEGNRIVAAIERWCQCTERLLALEQTFPSRTLRVTYEQLVKNPEHELTRIWSFLGVKAVAGLSTQAFKIRHGDGPGCYKVLGSNAIDPNRIGRGATLDVSGASAPLRKRVSELLQALSYLAREEAPLPLACPV